MSASKSSKPQGKKLTEAELRRQLEDLEKGKDRGVGYYYAIRDIQEQLAASSKKTMLSC